MLKIGDFSKLAQVSVKTLRHYGRLGLLKPAWVDRFTGYRYYSLDQLPRLNRVLALKDLGFSLEQIGELLREDLPIDELRGMMRLKRAEMERHIQAEQARLARIEARLMQIERGGAMPAYEVVLKPVLPQRVVGIRDVVVGYHDMERLFGELYAYLRTHATTVEPIEPGIAIYYDAEYLDRGIDAEAAVPLLKSLPASPRTIVHELPGVENMACAISRGGPQSETLPEARNALTAWIEANGYRVVGPNRDVYLERQESRPATDTVTEVQFPVQRKPIPTFMTQFKEANRMEPKIVSQPAFTVVGMKYRGKNENNEIPQLWQAFGPRMGEVQHKVAPEVAYGVCSTFDEQSGEFDYVAGFEVDSTAGIPEGMVSFEVPGGKYAIFTCTLPTIGEAYKYAFETWLPQSGHRRADRPDFELYDEKFEPSVLDSEMFIYIPIE
jgi:predicted transcriptional regulator YdeE/DNA-binding transcriptional MerR regulator